MKREALVGWMMAAVVVGMALVAGSAGAATTVFQDRIDHWRVQATGKRYTNQCPGVVVSQDSGQNRPFYVQTTSGIWTAPSGDEFVPIQGGDYSFNTLAATNSVTNRYGQIFWRIGYGFGANYTASVRLGLFNTVTPLFDYWTASGVGPLVYLHDAAGGAWNGASSSWVSFAVPTNEFNITVNYDLQAKTYDMWLDTTLVGANLGFYDAGFGAEARSIAIGATYAQAPYNNAILDEWYWKSDNASAFTNCGQQLPGPGPNAVKTVFLDWIKGTNNFVWYTNVNPRVMRTQFLGTTYVRTNSSVCVVPPGDEVVELNSGSQFNFETLAVTNAAITDRYGQIYVRCAVAPLGSQFLRLALFDTANPQFPTGSWAPNIAATNTAADFEWEQSTGRFWYFKNSGQYDTGVSFPTQELHDVTINYDLGAGLYEVWVNTNRIVTSAPFSWSDFPTQVCAIAIGGAYYLTIPPGNGYPPALDSWCWKTANATPFVQWFTPPPPAGIVFRLH